MTCPVNHHPIYTLFLRVTARASVKHPWLTCMIWLILGVGGGLAAFFCLGMDANEDSLISEELPYNKTYKDYLRAFGDQEYLYAVIQVPAGGHKEDQSQRMRAASAADNLVEKLSVWVQQGELLEVFARYVIPKLDQRFLLYESPDALAEHAQVLSSALPELKPLLSTRRLSDFIRQVRMLIGRQWSKEALPKDLPMTAIQHGAQCFKALCRALASAVNAPAAQPLPLPALLPLPLDRIQLASYLFTQKGSIPGRYDAERPGVLLVHILPKKDYTSLEVIAKPLRHIRQALDEVRKAFPDLEMGLTGRPAIHADEMATTNRDVTLATCIAFPLVGLIFFALFRSVLRPLFALLALALALGCTYGFAVIAVGQLNLLSIVFTLILIGLGIDFGIHILARYLEETAAGVAVKQAAINAVVLTGRGCLSAALTSSVAFLSALFTDFAGLAELGLISGAGILFSLCTAISFLPAALCLWDGRGSSSSHRHAIHQVRTLPLLDAGVRHWRIVLTVSLLLLAGALPVACKVGLNRNLLSLQADGLESVDYERCLISHADVSTWEGICIVESRDDAVALSQAMRKRSEVRQVDDFSSLMPSNEFRSRSILADLDRLLADMPEGEPFTNLDPLALKAELDTLGRWVSPLNAAFLPAEWAAALESMETAVRALGLPAAGDPVVLAKLAAVEKAFFRGLLRDIHAWRQVLSPPPMAWAELPEGLKKRFTATEDGGEQHLVRIFPAGNAWDFSVLSDFVHGIREQADAMDFPVVTTGVAINFYESVKVMERAFITAFLLAMVFVAVLVYQDMRSLRFTALAMGILGLGVLWTAGVMGLTGLRVNLANFFAFPVIIGIGIDSAFHLIHRYREDSMDPACLNSITATAVILSSLTTLIGLGSLMTASHRGLASLGTLLAVGTVLCLTASLIVLPAFFRYLKEKRQDP